MGSVDLRGRTYPQSVSLRVDRDTLPANDVEYSLGGSWKRFVATIGVSDDSPTGGSLTFELNGDNRILYMQQLSKGDPRELRFAVAGMQTLKLKVKFTRGEYYDNYSHGVWGDARLEK
ncbi:NPCBM/NEW2 domain-containing protein [Streptomyces triculaminicus]|uniref:NPCBM/NEW2 domain-containing protein n=1 Tax=Streptomyces triculaminicus TaxID=2816232 RepID=A0A939FQ97_9ACTN|nr:NPCBM/NEW2 domain-containing protein [Streptomyces triculaminicus]